MSGPNCLISLGLTFNDVVLCRYKTMKAGHKKIPSKCHLCPIWTQMGHKSWFDSGLGSPQPQTQALDTKKKEAFLLC
jgi:hypothetical protein